MHIVNFHVKILGFLLYSAHNFKEIYFVKIKQAQYTPVLAQNKLLAMFVLNLLSKNGIPVYCDMLSVSTSDISFRLPLNFTMNTIQ